MKFLKKASLVSFILILISCAGKTTIDTGFTLSGEVKDYEYDYIFISYDGIVDSSLVKNGRFQFKGSIEKPAPIIFTTHNSSASSRSVYLENAMIDVDLTLKKRELNNGLVIDWVVINNVNGSKTDSLSIDFEEFKIENKNSNQWSEKLYNRLVYSFKKYPKNRLMGSILFSASIDTILTNPQLRELYDFIDWNSQSVLRHDKVKYSIFPERNAGVGGKIRDFALKNEDGKELRSLDYRGSYVLLDFWASWCVPCIEEFPKLSKISQDYKNDEFKIIGISVDESEERWLKALDKYNLEWDNVIGEGGLKSDIARTYQVFAIPTNFLIDKEGNIIAKDVEPDDLAVFLSETLN